MNNVNVNSFFKYAGILLVIVSAVWMIAKREGKREALRGKTPKDDIVKIIPEENPNPQSQGPKTVLKSEIPVPK